MNLVEFEDGNETENGESPGVVAGYLVLTVVLSLVVPDFVTEVLMANYGNDEQKDILHAIIAEVALCIVPFVVVLIRRKCCKFGRLCPLEKPMVCASCVFSSCLMSISLVQPGHCSSTGNVSVMSVVVQCLFPAVCEEFVFRGWLFSVMMQSQSFGAACVITSLVFSILHKWIDVMSTVIIFTLSLVWMYADFHTNSLIPSIIGHYFHNLTLSTLTNAYPSLCRIPKEGSLVMWVVAAIVLFLAIGREDRQIPQALQA